MFDKKTVLITGGTGSLGKALTKKLLSTNVERIRIFSRDELKQVEMASEYSNDKRLRFLIGDIREKERLLRALEDVDIVIHAAALKHVPVAEYNPFEAVKTNVDGAQNVIDACLDKNIELALAIGTDKAVAPLNTYGATKLLMERLFVSANYYKGLRTKMRFLCVRYGNVLGSRGSLVPTLVKQIQDGKKITITDLTMTRFNITMDNALELVFRAMTNGIGGQIFIPKLKAYRVVDMKDAIMELLDAKNDVEIISVRPGEKFHEVLISQDEIRNVYETNEDYVLDDVNLSGNSLSSSTFKKSSITEQYSSNNVSLYTKNELKDILLKEKLVPIS